MTRQEWIEAARKHEEVLRELLRKWHPRQETVATAQLREDLVYSAPGAERACEVVRDAIRKEGEGQPKVLSQFTKALADGDVETLYGLLQQAWFGVPETTGCWKIVGFKEAVDLLDDIPEDEEATNGAD